MIRIKSKYDIVKCSICGKPVIYKKVYPAVIYRQGFTQNDAIGKKPEELVNITIGTIFICEKCIEKISILKENE